MNFCCVVVISICGTLMFKELYRGMLSCISIHMDDELASSGLTVTEAQYSLLSVVAYLDFSFLLK